MENQTTDDLNRQIQTWRETLAQSPALRAENLNELESHLRDSIDLLQTRGLSAEEAFWVASRRVGAGGQITAEYGKVNRSAVWLDRMLWMLVGVQIWAVVLGILRALAIINSEVFFSLSQFPWLQSDTAFHRVLVIATLTFFQLLALAGSLAFCWWLIMRQGGKLGAWVTRILQRRLAVFAIGGILFNLIFAHLLPQVLYMLQIRVTQLPARAHQFESLAFSTLFVNIFQTIVLVIITILLARKRLKSVQAVLA